MTTDYELRQAIIDKINDSVADGTLSYVGEACWMPDKIKKMPAVVVMPEPSESEYQNTAGGRHRVFIYRAYVLKAIENESQTDTEKLITHARDELIELFDKKNALELEGLLSISPVPTIPDIIDYGGGEARVFTLILRCNVIVSTT